jgi:outer membrane beta-barrel protein
MEIRIRILLLTGLLALSGCSMFRGAETADAPAPASATGESQSAIVPQVERREVRLTDIANENWEAGAFVGALSVEDFEVNMVYGARLAYHISEDFFAEGVVGSSDAGLSSYERVSGSGPLLTSKERQFRYWTAGFGWNVLPGEMFLRGDRAYNSAIYLVAGAGSTSFAGADRFTVTFGTGIRMLIGDSLAAHLDFRDHIMEVDVFGKSKQTHNFEASLSLSGFF